MVSWWGSKLMKFEVDEMELIKGKLMKLQVDEMTNRWGSKLMKWQVDEIASWWNANLMNQHTAYNSQFMTTIWWNDALIKWQLMQWQAYEMSNQ